MYKRVVEIMEIFKIENIFFSENLNSSTEFEIFSNPINAQGEIHAILTTWETADLSGIKAGLKVDMSPPRCKNEAMKQTVIPAVKVTARIIIMISEIFFDVMHSIPAKRIAMIDKSASPRYIS